MIAFRDALKTRAGSISFCLMSLYLQCFERGTVLAGKCKGPVVRVGWCVQGGARRLVGPEQSKPTARRRC